ncbi:MAG TPA: DPP IV N-terminal domain-containing protein [Dehalococcoidia bacterium]|nr:DPP IV N-terminal domain-containing protein [Dehalococcoidia bacterium]
MRRLLALLALSLCGAGLTWLVWPDAAQAEFREIVQLTSDAGNHLRPTWSPDGLRLAYQADTAGSNDIWIINADGSGQQPLTSGPADDRRPSWSPDGKWLAFDSDREGSRDIWIVSAKGNSLRRLTTSPDEETFPVWSPDGRQIAFYRYNGTSNDIWVTDSQQETPRPLMKNLASIEQRECTFACHAVSWSPEGQAIAYTSGDLRAIWLVDTKGENQRQLAAPALAGAFRFPSFTVDGKVRFQSEEHGEKIWTDLWSIAPDGTSQTRLLSRVDHGGPFAWNPEGTLVAFHSPRSGHFQIYLASLQGSVPELPPPPAVIGSARQALIVGATTLIAVLVAVALGLYSFLTRRRA